MTFTNALARQEGFFAHGSRPQRDHNPGDIEWSLFARCCGATTTDGRFAIFPDDASGFAALRKLLLAHYAGLTIAAAIAKWAPATENDVARYVANVCEWTGFKPTDILTAGMIQQ